MSEKILKTRIIQKHATEEIWDNSTFIPLDAEVIIYDEDDNYAYKRIKIGDGKTLVKELPFIDTIINDKITNKTQVQIITWEADD